MTQSASLGAGLDWKTSLQELAASAALGTPEYHVDESGPDHEKQFVASAVVGAEVLGHGTGRKKEAEQRAAEQAWATLDGRRRPAPCSSPRSRDDPTYAYAWGPGGPVCLSSRRSRLSAAVWRPTSSVAGSRRPSSAVRASCAATSRARPTSARGSSSRW